MKVRSFLILIFLVFSSCNCEQEPLKEVLGNSCYTDLDGDVVEINKESSLYNELNIGACSTGLTARDAEEKLVCLGEIKPKQETCNNIDDDCNIYIDDRWNGIPLSIPPHSQSNECVGPGVCSQAEQKCINGGWQCVYPDSYGKEVCDGLDNDCDGEIDEDTFDDPLFTNEERYVYSADPDTINVGECRAGYKECVDGAESIRNMITPTTEICGNGDDDDCDGLVDEDENGSTETDFVFIIDFSASMDFIIDQVSTALCSWSSQGLLQRSRFAVVAIGFTDSTSGSRQIKVLTDFTDSNTACGVVRSSNITSHYGYIENQLSAVYETSLPDNPNSLSWSADNDRKVLIFSDEMLQQDIAGSVTEAIEMVVTQCIEQDYIIGAFIQRNIHDEYLWLDMVTRCNGFIDYLSTRPQEMIDTLNYWVGTDC